ncbi:MAG: dockerin type I domain-containing protein [bacterium]|nr:dockerin type I domain-containing protein [bacterium]
MAITDIDDENHIRLFNYDGTTNLINSTFDETKLEYNGSGSGQINQQFTVDYTIVDANGNPVSGAEVELLDVRGDTIFSESTDADGVVTQQTVIAKTFDYANQSGATNNPHILRIRKYGFNFVTLTTEISAKTIQSIALTDDAFKGAATETLADAITGITFVAPTKVTYANAETEVVSGDIITLNNASTTQSEFFAIFNDDTGEKISESDFTVNYSNANGKAVVTFATDKYNGTTTRAIYSYGGSITMTNGTVDTRSLTDVYDFLRGQQEEVFTTVDGIAYTSFVDINIGDAVTSGSIVDPNKSLSFKEGFGLRFGAAGGFIDLSGVTAGGGLNIKDSVGSTYFPGETASIISTVQDNKGILVGGAQITVTIRDQNSAVVTTGTSNEITAGFYRFNYALPLTAATGTYFAQIDATSGGQEVHDNVSFIVNPRLGNFPLAISSVTGSIYAPGEEVAVFSNTVDEAGNLVNASVDVYIFDSNETRIFSGTSTNISTGFFKATTTLASTTIPGTYRVRTDASLNGGSTTTASIAFIVTRPSLNIHNSVGSTYNAGGTVRVFSTAMSASGTPVGANIDVYVFNPSDTLVSSGSSTQLTTGFFEHSFALGGSATLGTYRVKIDAQYAGFEAHDALAFVVEAAGGGGGGGGLALNIFDAAGGVYQPRDEIAIFSTTINASGTPVAADVSVYIYDPSNTLAFSASSTELSTGLFKATTTIGTASSTGTYLVKVDALFGGNEVHDVLAFTVTRPPLKLSSGVGSIYILGETAEIFSTVMEENGTLADSANIDVYVFDSAGTRISAASSTELSAGRFSATTAIATTSPTGTYRVDIDAQFAGQEAHETLAFQVVKSLGGEPLNIKGDVGAEFSAGDIVKVVVTAQNATGTLVSATVNMEIFDPSGSSIASGAATEISTGFFEFETTLAAGVAAGTYRVQIDATHNGNETHDALAFTVRQPSSPPLLIYNDTGASYAQGDELAVFTTAVDATSTPVSANVDYYIYRPDDTLFTSGSSTQLSTGFFKATTTLVSALASTASTSPTTVTNDTATGTIAWVDLDNATTSSNTYASTTLAVSEVSNYLVAANFGFSIPADATIIGIAVDVEKSKDGPGNIQDGDARIVKKSAIGSNDKSLADNWPTTDTTSTYGGFEDLWGETWTADDINSANFGFAISAKETGVDSANAHIDQVRIKVYYRQAMPLGTYRVQIDATHNGNEAHENLAFTLVESATSQQLILYNNTGASYEVGNTVDIFSTTLNATGTPVEALVDVYVFNPSNTLVSSGSSTVLSTGFFKYNFVLSSASATGTYSARIDAKFAGNETSGNVAFVVNESSVSTQFLLFNNAGAVYDPGDEVAVLSTVLSATGTLASADVDVYIFDPDDNRIFAASSTLISTGFYRATTTLATSSPAGTYRVQVDAFSGGTETHEALTFVIKRQPLNIKNSVGVRYNPSDPVRIFTAATDAFGVPRDAQVDVYVFDSSDALVTNGTSTKILTGFYEFSFNLAAGASLGTYRVQIDAWGSEAHDALAFTVETEVSTSGGLALNVFDAVGGEYTQGDEVAVFAAVVDSTGALVSGDVDVYIFDPDDNRIFAASSTELSTGLYKATTTLSSSATVGTYRVQVDAFSGADEIHSVSAFNVSKPALTLNVFSDMGASYALGDEVAVYTTAFDGSGNPVSANVDVYVFNPSDSLIFSGTSTQLVTGFFKATTTLSSAAPTGTYSVRIDSQFGGEESHQTLAFSVASSTSGGLSLNLQANTGTTYKKGDTVSVYSTVFDSNGKLVDGDVDVYIYNPSDVLVASASSTKIDTGFYRATTTLATTTPTGTYRVKIDASAGGNEAHANLAFNVEATNWTIVLSDFGEVFASASNEYRTKVFIFNPQNSLADPFSTPTVTIYDPSRNINTDAATMTKLETGVYEYTLALSSGSEAGTWETVVSVETEEDQTFKQNDFWEVESAPAQVIVNSITDNTVPSITANVTITNEGSTAFEYHYEYCVVTTQDNLCGGGNDVNYASAAKLIQPGVDFITDLSLTVSNTGTYFFKVAVTWGTEKSFASRQFDAVEESESEPEPEPEPAPSGGGGGGGGGGALAPVAAIAPILTPSCNGADFNKDGKVNSIDFSILLFFWKTAPPFANGCVDVNKDAQVNSVDFSILLFQWGTAGTPLSLEIKNNLYSSLAAIKREWYNNKQV